MPNPLLQYNFTRFDDFYRQSLELALEFGNPDSPYAIDALAGDDLIEVTRLPKQLSPAGQGIPQVGYGISIKDRQVFLGSGDDGISATGITTGLNLDIASIADVLGGLIRRSELYAGDGNDSVTGTASGESFGYMSIGVNVQATARLSMGFGDDRLHARGGDVGLMLANNRWYGDLTSFYGDIVVDMGAGNDVIEAVGGDYGVYAERSQLVMGDGGDRIQATGDHGIEMHSSSLLLGAGRDRVVANGLRGFVLSDSVLDAGSGGDRIGTTAAGQALVLSDALLLMGNGNDIVDTLTGHLVTSSDDYIDLGQGRDVFKGFGSALLKGGDGTDSLILPDGRYTITMRQNTSGFAVALQGSSTMYLDSIEKIAGSLDPNGVNLMVGTLSVINGRATLV